MVTKRKIKDVVATKAKVNVKKKEKSVIAKKKAAGKKIVIGKKVVVAKTPVKVTPGKKPKTIQRKKALVKPKIKNPAAKQLDSSAVIHGLDLHLIPVTGEIHPARIEETHQYEKNYKHNEETAIHFEQKKAKQIMAMTRGGGGKRFFKNRGQR